MSSSVSVGLLNLNKNDYENDNFLDYVEVPDYMPEQIWLFHIFFNKRRSMKIIVNVLTICVLLIGIAESQFC